MGTLVGWRVNEKMFWGRSQSNRPSVVATSIVLTPSGTISITAGGGITVTNALMRVQGNGGAVDITANPQIAAGIDGQLVVIQGMSDSNTVKLEDGTGVALDGGTSITLGLNDNISLVYSSASSEWQEVGGRNALN